MNQWTQLPSNEVIKLVVEKLAANGFNPLVAENKDQAKQMVLSMLPKDAEVLANTSITLHQTGIFDAIENSGNYISVRKKYMSLDRQKDADEIRRLRSVQEYAVGSVHAVTHDGQLMIASNSGSQIPGEAYAAKHVVFVISTNKIVENMEKGMQRIFEYTLPLETVRARKEYGLPDTWNSYPSKILLFNREPVPNRINVVLVKEVLGY